MTSASRVHERLGHWPLALLCAIAITLQPASPAAESIPVRHSEGIVHGFLVLRATDGTALADGDLEQTAKGDRVTSRLTFRFKDGSLHEETAVFSQRGNFQLLSDHLVQKGPSFPNPLDVTIAQSEGRVVVRYNDDGQPKVADERLELPADVSNGLMLTLLKNVAAGAAPFKVSMVVATPKPRLVKLAVTNAGQEPFAIGTSRRTATHYIVTVEIGGVSGLVAPLLGKQPPDTHVWILGGDVPAFVKSEGPMYFGGPIWRIELSSPVWPRSGPARTARSD